MKTLGINRRQPGLPGVFDFYEDPGHGWLKARKALLHDLGIAGEISDCSRQRGDWAFLEEDCDMGVLLDALRARGIAPRLRRHVTDQSSRVRSYASYAAAPDSLAP